MTRPPDHDPTPSPEPVSHDQIERAMGVWREAAHQVEAQLGPEWQRAFNRDVAAGLHSLSRFTTMPDLVHGYLATCAPPNTPDTDADQALAQALAQLQAAAGANMTIFDLRTLETATYFWRAQQLIAGQTGTGGAMREDQEHTGRTLPVELDPYALDDLERAPLTETARAELRRRMFAGEEVYPYQSAGPNGRWCVWLTDEPGRVHIDVWEAIVQLWQTRAQVKRLGSPAELIARYGVQGPPALQAAVGRLSAIAMLRRESPDHPRQILRYAHREADSYLQARTPDEEED